MIESCADEVLPSVRRHYSELQRFLRDEIKL